MPLFGNRHLDTGSGLKVLVSSLDSDFRECLEADASIYSRHYRDVSSAFFSELGELHSAIERSYDILHLFSRLSDDGSLLDSKHQSLSGTDLIQECCERGSKLLWIANANAPGGYIKGFRAGGKPLNLIMTLERRGAFFEDFLEKLLCRLAAGETLPVAWPSLVPQSPGPWHEQLPSCIVYAGQPNVKLLP